MNRLSFYLGRKVIIRFTSGYVMKGLLEQYNQRDYYIVLRDGSRSYFRDSSIEWIKYDD